MQPVYLDSLQDSRTQKGKNGNGCFQKTSNTNSNIEAKMTIPKIHGTAVNRKLFLLLGAASLLFSGCMTNLAEKSVVLTKNGKPAGRIVIAQKATKAAQFGALELQNHLKLITGAEFQIVTDKEPQLGFEIRVGETARSSVKNKDFKLQEFLVDVRSDAIELVGYDKPDFGKFIYKPSETVASGKNWPGLYDAQGTMYAVYDFLENQCGVIWMEPSNCGTLIPKTRDLSVVPGKKRTMPFILYRGVSDNIGIGQEQWKRRSPGSYRYLKEAYKPFGNRALQDRLFLLRNRAGGDYAPANHSFYLYYERFWKQRNDNFEGYHPEFFAKGYTGLPPQLCYSNPATVAQVVKDIRNYFDHGGYKKKYYNINRVNAGYIWGENHFCLEPMDNAAFCKCENCTKEYELSRAKDKSEHSTHWFNFVNKVAREIQKSHPSKKITTLAYATHEGLPNGIRLEDNVIVYFCISANRTCYSDLLNKQLMRMKAWRKAYPDQPMALWFYNTFPKETASNGNFHCFPGYFAKEEVRQYQFLKKWNIRNGIFHCGFNGITDNWIQLKLMFNPDYTADQLLDTFFSGYGKAGKYLREFYEVVENRYCDKSLYPKGSTHQTQKIAWGILGTPEVMAKLTDLMKKAETAAETTEEKQRVKLWKMDVYDYMKEGFETYQQRTKAPVPQWTFRKIRNANGDPLKINWKNIPAVKMPLFIRGGNTVGPLNDQVQGAYDDKFFYLALTENTAPAKLENSPAIAPYDTWELVIARQEAQPYRHYMSSPDGRLYASSFGEVNWRQGVPSKESGLVNYGAVCRTDVTQKSFWVTYYAFPLATMLNVPLKEGDVFYMGLTRVTNPRLINDRKLGIYTAVSYTTVHTIDRSVKITLKK